MNDILKLLKLVDSMEKKKTTKLTESSVEECGDMGSMSMPAQNPGNPVTASITLNASGMEHVADLMRLLQQAGLEKAGPVATAPLPMRADMEQLRDKMNGLEGPVSAPKEQYFDVNTVTAGGDDIHSRKEPEDIRVKDGSISHEIRNNEEFANEPDEEYGDHLDMIKRLSGGLNREKGQYKAAQPGDNAMAVERDLDEAYINTSNDAMNTLGALRKIGKSIERGQGSYDGNLANMYATDVYDVYSFIEKQTNGFQDIDPKAKAAIDAMMQLRGQAKKMERELGSGKNARFGNDIATTLYPVMSWLSSTNFDRNKTEDNSNESSIEESIKTRLYKALSEKKAKPDFLDVDKDGDKKEPMKKALKDKEKKVDESLTESRFRLVSKAEKNNRSVKIYKDTEWDEFVVKHYENGEYMQDADYYDSDKQAAVDTAKYFLKGSMSESKSKPDFLDMDKDGDKKEPMKKAIADKKKGAVKEAELDEISKSALMNYRTSAKIHRRQNDEIIGSQMASNKQVNKAEKDNIKRTKGIDRAAKRIEK